MRQEVRCPGCHHALDPDWAYCEACGRPLADTDNAGPLQNGEVAAGEPARPAVVSNDAYEATSGQLPTQRGFWIRSSPKIATAAVLLAAVLAALGWSETKDHLRVAQQDRDLLSATVEERDLAIDGLRGQLAKAQERADDARQALRRAQGLAELQDQQIDVLRQCLKGVSIAFSGLIYGDYGAVVGALQAVEDPCASAFQYFD